MSVCVICWNNVSDMDETPAESVNSGNSEEDWEIFEILCRQNTVIKVNALQKHPVDVMCKQDVLQEHKTRLNRAKAQYDPILFSLLICPHFVTVSFGPFHSVTISP